MTRTTEIEVGQRWKRRVEHHDMYDVVEVVAYHAYPDLPAYWTVAPALEFGPPVDTESAGLLDFCDLIEEASDDD